jgi:hypothetical protein
VLATAARGTSERELTCHTRGTAFSLLPTMSTMWSSRRALNTALNTALVVCGCVLSITPSRALVAQAYELHHPHTPAVAEDPWGRAVALVAQMTQEEKIRMLQGAPHTKAGYIGV